jgi:hypothetical protein
VPSLQGANNSEAVRLLPAWLHSLNQHHRQRDNLHTVPVGDLCGNGRKHKLHKMHQRPDDKLHWEPQLQL